MAEVVAGAILTVSFQKLFDQITSGSGYIYDFIKGKDVNESLLRELGMKLLSADSLMDDAEAKQLQNPHVRMWLAKLKAAMYDADDLVDEIDAEALWCKIEGESASHLQQVQNFMSTMFKKNDVELKTKKIIDRLQTILQQKDLFGLKGGVPKIPSYRAPETTSLVYESGVYGRDDDKNVILKLLLSDEVSNNKEVSVIAIEGMGGIGKTTLAQLIYNDDRVKNHFDNKAWSCVSDDFDIFRITKAILESATSQTCDISTNLNRVQEKLMQALVGKKFLIVLDDVWNEDYMEWDKLRIPLLCGARGSTIIVTTRSGKIANMMQTFPSHKLEIMSEDDCWSLFAKHAFGNIVEPCAHPELEEIGKQIVKKCQGLPLAVKVLGGLLRSERNPQEWENILKSEIWKSPENKHKILPSLWLSYYYLPPHLKRCFAYCSIFPKDYEFRKENLIFYWMGENLLKPHERKSIEDVGEEYFNDLLSRSLFQGTKKGNFTMHDLINDLAKFVYGESCLRLDDEVLEVADTVSKIAGKATRHVLYMRNRVHVIKNLKDLCDVKILRTLIWTRRMFSTAEDQDFEKDLVHLLESMQYLRVLEIGTMKCSRLKKVFDSTAKLMLLRYLRFDCVNIEEIPDSFCTLYNLQTLILYGCCCTKLLDKVGNLKKLRHLELTQNDSFMIEELPDTVCNLHELRTLKLVGCNFECLPDKITMLTNLRHLILYRDLRSIKIGEMHSVRMPPQIWKWKNLQTMPGIKLGRDTGANIKYVGELQHLQGYLKIGGLENVGIAEDARGANLKDKKGITRLELSWSGECDDSRLAREVLEKLQPHTDLRELEIDNYGGTSFPSWFGYKSFSCIKKIKLYDCNNCIELPALGQLPCLEDLCITGFGMLERIGKEFYYSSDNAHYVYSSLITKPPFKSLKSLTFSRMAEWKEWSVVELVEGSGRALLNLEMLDCPNLSLPEHLPSLCKMKIRGFNNMKAFPAEGRRLPSNIKSIKIEGCHELESFSEVGWPSNLTSIDIWECEKLFTEKQWNLGMLSSLTSLVIQDINGVIDTFPEKEGQLPTTLTSLTLLRMQNLKSLNGKAFQRLTSLKKLSISNCKQLQCLVEETLPSSLSLLSISGCVLLKPRCQRETGEDWSKILHIPQIYIDGKRI